MSTYVFVVRDSTSDGERMTGLTPTWAHFRLLSDLSDVGSPPAIVEIGNGQYAFDWDAAADGEVAGQVDAGSDLANPGDRYIDVVVTLAPNTVTPPSASAIASAVVAEMPTIPTAAQNAAAAIAAYAGLEIETNADGSEQTLKDASGATLDTYTAG